MSKLRRVLGPVQFDHLCSIAGGQRLHIPRHYGKPPNGGRDTTVRLKRLFGESLAILLVFHFGGVLIRVPTRRGNANWEHRRRIAKRLKRLIPRRDLSANQIARRIGCDCSTVEKHRSRMNGHRKGIENGG